MALINEVIGQIEYMEEALGDLKRDLAALAEGGDDAPTTGQDEVPEAPEPVVAEDASDEPLDTSPESVNAYYKELFPDENRSIYSSVMETLIAAGDWKVYLDYIRAYADAGHRVFNVPGFIRTLLREQTPQVMHERLEEMQGQIETNAASIAVKQAMRSADQKISQRPTKPRPTKSRASRLQEKAAALNGKG